MGKRRVAWAACHRWQEAVAQGKYWTSRYLIPAYTAFAFIILNTDWLYYTDSETMIQQSIIHVMYHYHRSEMVNYWHWCASVSVTVWMVESEFCCAAAKDCSSTATFNGVCHCVEKSQPSAFILENVDSMDTSSGEEDDREWLCYSSAAEESLRLVLNRVKIQNSK